jgi:hypothetical protein
MKKLSEERTVIVDVIKNVNSDKNSKVANTFSKTFLLSAIILIVMSICGVFTDRKQKGLTNYACFSRMKFRNLHDHAECARL